MKKSVLESIKIALLVVILITVFFIGYKQTGSNRTLETFAEEITMSENYDYETILKNQKKVEEFKKLNGKIDKTIEDFNKILELDVIVSYEEIDYKLHMDGKLEFMEKDYTIYNSILINDEEVLIIIKK